MLLKLIMIIPVFLEVVVLGIYSIILTIINAFFVLFTGKYWDHAYKISLGLFRLSVKISFFVAGLTDKYPGFDLSIRDKFKVDLKYPKNPNRIFAIPIIGFLIRIILLVPFLIYSSVINYAAIVGLMVSAFSVLINKKYPDSIFELQRDSTRIHQSSSVYIFGLSDKYPSFSIAMNHKTTKTILIAIGIIITVLYYFV